MKKDLGKLKSVYGDIKVSGLYDASEDGAIQNSDFGRLWYVCMRLSRNANDWNRILRVILGYDLIIDRDGIIHINERSQCVFLDSSKIDVIEYGKFVVRDIGDIDKYIKRIRRSDFSFIGRVEKDITWKKELWDRSINYLRKYFSGIVKYDDRIVAMKISGWFGSISYDTIDNMENLELLEKFGLNNTVENYRRCYYLIVKLIRDGYKISDFEFRDMSEIEFRDFVVGLFSESLRQLIRDDYQVEDGLGVLKVISGLVSGIDFGKIYKRILGEMGEELEDCIESNRKMIVGHIDKF